MQSVSSRIWTSVAVSISYDDNHYNIKNMVCFECGYVSHKSSYCQYKQKRKKQKF